MTLRFPPGMEPLVLSFPEELERDGLRVRLPTLADVDAVAPAFLDPEVGGEAGMPPFGADDLRVFVTHLMPEFMATGRLAPYVIEVDGEVLGGISLHHFDDGRRSIEVGYWLYPTPAAAVWPAVRSKRSSSGRSRTACGASRPSCGSKTKRRTACSSGSASGAKA